MQKAMQFLFQLFVSVVSSLVITFEECFKGLFGLTITLYTIVGVNPGKAVLDILSVFIPGDMDMLTAPEWLKYVFTSCLLTDLFFIHAREIGVSRTRHMIDRELLPVNSMSSSAFDSAMMMRAKVNGLVPWGYK